MSMLDFHDQLLEEGMISVLWTQFLIQSGHEPQFQDVAKQVSLFFKHASAGEFSQANSDQHLAVQYYCGHLPLGNSLFCDYVWRFWEMKFVQTIVFLSMFSFNVLILGTILGAFEYEKKKAFEAI